MPTGKGVLLGGAGGCQQVGHPLEGIPTRNGAPAASRSLGSWKTRAGGVTVSPVPR